MGVCSCQYRTVLRCVRRRNRKRAKKAPAARSKAEKCVTKYCRNRKALKRTSYKAATGQIIVYEHFLEHCWKCHSRRLKETRPWTYVLNMLRHSARKRNLPFTLTVASFKAWCQQTGYLEKRGNKPGDLTVDRINENEGYHIWNLQVLTHAENSAQGADNTPRAERGTETADTYEPPETEAAAAAPPADDEPF